MRLWSDGSDFFLNALYSLKTQLFKGSPHDLLSLHFSYSALKKDGQRLSVLLKRGQKVEAKPARPVTVYSLTLQDFKAPLFTLGQHVLHPLLLSSSVQLLGCVCSFFLFLIFQTINFVFICGTDIECGGGFYVRSLVDDLGKGSFTFYALTKPLTERLVGWNNTCFCCSSVIVCSCEGADQNQAGSVHPAGPRLTRGPVDPGEHPQVSAALCRRRPRPGPPKTTRDQHLRTSGTLNERKKQFAWVDLFDSHSQNTRSKLVWSWHDQQNLCDKSKLDWFRPFSAVKVLTRCGTWNSSLIELWCSVFLIKHSTASVDKIPGILLYLGLFWTFLSLVFCVIVLKLQ